MPWPGVVGDDRLASRKHLRNVVKRCTGNDLPAMRGGRIRQCLMFLRTANPNNGIPRRLQLLSEQLPTWQRPALGCPGCPWYKGHCGLLKQSGFDLKP